MRKSLFFHATINDLVFKCNILAYQENMCICNKYTAGCMDCSQVSLLVHELLGPDVGCLVLSYITRSDGLRNYIRVDEEVDGSPMYYYAEQIQYHNYLFINHTSHWFPWGLMSHIFTYERRMADVIELFEEWSDDDESY